MKKIIFFFIIPFSVFGQTNFSINQGIISPNQYFEELPYEFLKGQIIINVSIDGKNYRFSLDTGAPTSISDKLYTKLNAPVINNILLEDANNKKDSIKIVELETVKIGSITLEKTTSIVLDSDNIIYKCLDLDGNIGSNSLRNSVVQFDYLNRKIRITNSIKNFDLKKKDSQRIVLTSKQSSPIIPVKLIGKEKGRLQLLFDTGMEGLLDISLSNFSFFNEYDIFKSVKSSVGNNSVGLFGLTEDTLHYQVEIDRLKLGRLELKNVISQTTKSPNSRIGTQVLKFAVVTLDYRNKRIYFTPLGDHIQSAYSPRFPINPTIRDGKYQIGFIWSPDKVPNIQVGDEILSINGISCQDKSMCELIQFLDSMKVNELKLVTKGKNGKEYRTTIIKE